jgi:geranylgeranyl diphosphate synthase type I
VSGAARVELQGYGCVFDLRALQQALTDRIDRRIAEYFPRTMDEAHLRAYVGDPLWTHEMPAFTAVLSRPVWDLLERGGKHWRPIFGLLMLEALGVRSRPFELLVSVLSELMHTGALIIDDIEDSARARRGAQSIHRRYGLDVAINAANTLYFIPYLLLRRYPGLSERQRMGLYQILSEQCVRSHLGQSVDIYWSKMLTAPRVRQWMGDSLRPKILQAYADKTGAVVMGLAESACVIARSSARERRECVAFARRFGVAFQIIDDILDFDGCAKQRGRSGEDLAEGKLTYVLVSALERLPEPGRRALLATGREPGRQSRQASTWFAPPERSMRAGKRPR